MSNIKKKNIKLVFQWNPYSWWKKVIVLENPPSRDVKLQSGRLLLHKANLEAMLQKIESPNVQFKKNNNTDYEAMLRE